MWYKHWGADLAITLMDVFALDPAQLQGMNVAHWMPVDTARLSALDANVLSQSPGRPIAMSRHGERVLREAGGNPLYAPHALDMELWSPLPDRDDARRQMGWPDGTFLIGINAANQDPERKGFGEQVAAFAEFARDKDDVRLAIHSRAKTRMGPDLNHLIAYYGLQGKAGIGPQEMYATGMITEPMMVTWHAAMDVLSNCAYGEGFGLPVLQSQATGTPVIVTDCSSMTELCGSGWLVKGQDKWNRGHGAAWKIPFITDIAEAYEQAYQHARDPEVRQKAREFAVQYDAEKVYEQHWAAILDELAPRKAGHAAGPRRKVWGPVMYNGEADMLRMRLAETEGLIDHHVITEARSTHRGHPKALHFADSWRQFSRWDDRIAHVVADLPDGEPWALEHAQRDSAWPVIGEHAADDDIVLICDADEIPSASLIERARTGQLPDPCSVRMRTFIYAVDWEVPQDAIPPQCVIATAGYIRRSGGSLAKVRDGRPSYPEVTDGGWHFSWLGGPEAQVAKLDTSTCHTELLGSPEAVAIRTGRRYSKGVSAGGLAVTGVTVDHTWPAWIRQRRCPDIWFRPRPVPVPEPFPGGLEDATLIITAWRRPDYLRQVLSSWARADGIATLRRIVIALGPSDQEAAQRSLAASFSRRIDAEVEILTDSPACAQVTGPHRSIAEAANWALEDPGTDFLIFSEEDVQVSSDVLRYTSWARRELACEDRLLAILSHSKSGQGWDPHEPAQDAEADQDAVRLLPYFNAWGWATSRERWEKVIEPQWDWDGTSGTRGFDSGYDWNLQERIIPGGPWLCALPDASRSQNIGQDDGIYTTQWSWSFSQAQSFREHRDSAIYRLERE